MAVPLAAASPRDAEMAPGKCALHAPFNGQLESMGRSGVIFENIIAMFFYIRNIHSLSKRFAVDQVIIGSGLKRDHAFNVNKRKTIFYDFAADNEIIVTVLDQNSRQPISRLVGYGYNVLTRAKVQ